MGFEVNPTPSGVGFGFASGIVNLFLGAFTGGSSLFSFFAGTSATGEAFFSCPYTPPNPLLGRVSCGQINMTAAPMIAAKTPSPPNADGAKMPEVDRSKGFLDDWDFLITHTLGGDDLVKAGVPPPPSAERSLVGTRIPPNASLV